MILMRVLLLIVWAMATMAGSATASEPVRLYAAGSLRAALTEVAAAFEQISGNKIEAKYGASGLLRDEIVAGARTDVLPPPTWGTTSAIIERQKWSRGIVRAQSPVRAGAPELPSNPTRCSI